MEKIEKKISIRDNDHSTSSFIKLPFPPRITSSDLVSNKKNGDMPTRSPNAFMIYRKVYVDELHNEGHYLPMTTASSLASASWKAEAESVKDEYKRLANEAKSRHLKLFSNKIPRKKRNRKIRDNQNTWYNIVPSPPSPVVDEKDVKTFEQPNYHHEQITTDACFQYALEAPENNFTDFTAFNLGHDVYYYPDGSNLLYDQTVTAQIQPDYANYFNFLPFP